MLIDKDMKKKDLMLISGVSQSSVTKMGKNENVNTEVLVRICTALKCDIGDIAEIVIILVFITYNTYCRAYPYSTKLRKTISNHCYQHPFVYNPLHHLMHSHFLNEIAYRYIR